MDGGRFGEVFAFVDVNFCGGDSAAVDLFYLEGGVEIEGGGCLVEDGGIEAGIDEGAEKHVTTDTGKAVEVSDAHGGIVSCAAQEEGWSGGVWGKISCDEKVQIGIDCSRSRFHRTPGPRFECAPCAVSRT